MTAMVHPLVMRIDSPWVSPHAPNYSPTTWPPPRDFPVVVGADGRVISRFGDSRWDLTIWAHANMVVNFGDGANVRSDVPAVSSANADLLRLLVGWWLWGPNAARRPSTIVTYATALRPIFVLCTQRGILASQLDQFPSVADEIPGILQPSYADTILLLLHRVNEQRARLGFSILGREGLRRLSMALPAHQAQQKAFIPPRIWTYQLRRLDAFLTDFHANREAIEACFRFCLKAYVRNYGSLQNACSHHRNEARLPFRQNGSLNVGAKTGAKYQGSFSDVARAYGIDGLLQRWHSSAASGIDGPGKGVTLLSSYLTYAVRVGIAYLLNFTLMRINEAWSLRTNCYFEETDARFGKFSFIRGETTKTIEDSNAVWIAAECCRRATDAMAIVARLRMAAAGGYPIAISKEDHENPYFTVRCYEPWGHIRSSDRPLSVRPSYPSYCQVVDEYPTLFDAQEITIREADLQIAQLVTPNLDRSLFQVGAHWPFSWHQLRRSGAVQMQRSGLVSDLSLQYQLKHARLHMALYYGRGYSHLNVNSDAQAAYIRTMYEVLSGQIATLLEPRFVSPYGDVRKREILSLVEDATAKELLRATKEGLVTWRETVLGGCTRRGYCEFGGVDNIVRCGGGDGRQPCADALFDRNKLSELTKLREVIAGRLVQSAPCSPEHESLSAQSRALANAIEALSK